MSNRLLIKKSSVTAKVPLAGDLEYGELAINYTDEKIYFKNASNVIKSFSSGAGTVTSVGGAGTVSGLTLTGTVTSSGSLTLGGTLAVLPSNFASQTANTVLAAPDGAAGTPTFRNLTLNDLPDAWVKKSVGAATTAALTINTAQVTIDGVTLAASTRVLIKNQAAAGENGIYTGVTTTTWVRTPDADTASEIAGAFVNVDAGTVNGGRVFDNDFKSTDTLGTTAMDWSQNVDVGYFTTVGNSFATLANPTAITFPRINADNTVSALAAAAFRTAIGAGTSSTTGTVTSVAALTLGTTGTDITSTVATGTTTAVITLNVPTASAANRGALSAADWTTFNNKVGSLTDTLATVTGRGASTTTASTFSGGLSVTGLTVSKSGTDSLITFPAQTNDPGYIKHYESANAAIMYFSVSDDTGAADYFSFGSTPGGTYSEGLRLTAGGVVTVGTWQATSISTTYTDAKITSIAATSPIVTSAATGAITLSHAASGATAGTYNNVTVNATGHVTAGSNTAYLTAESDTLATVTARGASTSTAITLSGTLSFAQPVGLSFANGQYIKDNGSGGLVIYSGANINLTGTTVVTGTASVSGTLSTTGLLTGAFNSAAVIPPSLAGFTLGWNYTNGGGEVDFWNTYTPGADSFHWYQRTATPTATKLMALNTTGLTITGLVLATTGLYAGAATSGVTRGVVTSEGNFLSFYAAETTARVQLGRDVGISGGAGLALGGSTYALIAASDTAGTALHFKLSAAASTATTSPNMSLTATGLGIGIAGPAAKLHVVGQESRFGGVASGYISVYNASTRSGYIQANAGTDLRIASDTDPMTFYLTSERMRIGTDGTVGIGTAAAVNADGNLAIAGAVGTGQGAASTVAQLNMWETTSGNKAGVWIGAMTNQNTGVIGSRTATGNIAFQTYSGSWAERMRIVYNGNVLIGTATDGGYKLQVNGSFAATTKSFVIDHPTKPGMQLRHGSLEGPENGVYVRGRLKGNKIELPEYWTKLVDPDSITVNLTAIGKSQDIYVEDIKDNVVYVGGKNVNCFYTVYAERVDVAKLEVEIG